MSLRSRDNIQVNYTSTCSDSCTHVGPPLIYSRGKLCVELKIESHHFLNSGHIWLVWVLFYTGDM